MKHILASLALLVAMGCGPTTSSPVNEAPGQAKPASPDAGKAKPPPPDPG